MNKLDIEYAKPMSKEEVASFLQSLKTKQNKLIASSNDVVNRYSDKLIEAYFEFEKSLIEDNRLNADKHSIEMNAYSRDKCICGSELMLVSNGSFYGCVDYKNDGTHKNFMNHKINNWGAPKLYRTTRAKSYLSDIIQSLNLKGQINAKALASFYSDNDLPDLYERFNGKSSAILINRFSEVKKVANDFEREIHERLKPLYTTVLSQLYIKYKLKGGRERVCIPDFVCSNEREIVIIECKTNSMSVDDLQNALYFCLFEFMNNGSRELSIYNLIQDEPKTFKYIKQREQWVYYGKFFGYPSCCVDHFLNRKRYTGGKRINYHTGFTPCVSCSTKIQKPRDLEKLIENRICKTPFPDDSNGEGESYVELHSQHCPGYYANEYREEDYV